MKTLKKMGRIYRLIPKLYSQSLMWSAGYALTVALLPYCSLFVVSLLITLLSATPVDTAQTYHMLGVMLGANFLLNLLNHYFDAHNSAAEEMLMMHLDDALAIKQWHLPLATLEDPAIRKQLQEAKDGQNYNGGLYSFVASMQVQLLSTLFTLIISGQALISLFNSHATTSGWLANLTDGPLFIILLLGLITLPIMSASWLLQKSTRIRNEMYTTIVGSNNESFYYHQMFNSVEHEKTIRLYGLFDWLHNLNKQRLRKLIQSFQAVFLGKTLTLDMASELLVLLSVGLLYLLISLKAASGAITVGTVVLIAGYLQQTINQMNTMIRSIAQDATIIEYMQSFIDYLNLPDQNDLLGAPIHGDKKHVISFQHVYFTYPGTQKEALHDVSFDLHPGEKLALVGRNGSGKTTLIKLLCRFYTPQSGEILLDGRDIQSYRLADYLDMLAVVFQDFRLFAYSIAENVSTDNHPDPQRVQQALNLSGMLPRIAKMPQGIHTAISRELDDQGISVSGGEAQKIAIARAWYKDAPFVILDEPTAALDPISEYEIYRRFATLVKDKTAVYISHRMSSCRFCDRILVLDHGQLIQEGTHEQLIEDRDGIYAQLFYAQAQYYVDQELVTS